MARRKNKPRRNVVHEFDRYFGSNSRLENWQRLCRDLDLGDALSSITKCRKALRGVWVNIYDFLDAISTGTKVRRFHSERALSQYTLETERIYPKKEAKEGGPARALLAHIF